MTKLTEQEQSFYNDIIQDEINNGELSIFSVLFYGGTSDHTISKNIICEYFKDKYQSFFNNSIILFGAERSALIGKYKEYFWYANEDGGISFVGTVMPDILYFMTETHTCSISDEDGYEDLEYVLESRGLKIDDYINRYKYICEKNGYTFDLKWNYDEQKAKEFKSIIKSLK